MVALTPSERRGALTLVVLLLIGAGHDLWRGRPRAPPPAPRGRFPLRNPRAERADCTLEPRLRPAIRFKPARPSSDNEPGSRLTMPKAVSRRALCTACGLRRGGDPDDSDTAISACPARCGRRPRAAGGAAAASRARPGSPTVTK